MLELSVENNPTPTQRRLYQTPNIQTEPLFESNALESEGKSGERCLEFGDPCNDNCVPQAS